MYGVQERTEAPYRNRQRSVSTSLTGDNDCGHFFPWPILSPRLYEIRLQQGSIYSNIAEALNRSFICLWDFSEIIKQDANKSLAPNNASKPCCFCN